MQALIDDRKRRLNDADGEKARAAHEWLAKNPDVETLVAKNWRVVKIPLSAILSMGFSVEEPDADGHLNILGAASQFADRLIDFVELIIDGKATVLSADDCINE